MNWDRKMALDPHDTANTGAAAKTSNLNDELALVKWIFSDKTGTLTENVMDFQQASINGHTYSRAGEGELWDEYKSGGPNAEFIKEYLLNMAICHAVVPDTDDSGALVYKAASPDESALTDGARANKFQFNTRTQEGITVLQGDEEVSFHTPIILEFTSDRRRMSVLAKLPDGRIRMYSKGADSITYERLAAGNDELKQKTLDDIELFSKEGLRTLILAYRDFSAEEYNQLMSEWNEAATAMDGREAKMDAVADKMERDLQLIGATAIEDKLQDEVPETIHNLLRAGIKVWVITGDKQATAINIGYSCRLLNQNMDVVVVNAETSEDCGEQLRSHVNTFCTGKERDRKVGLVIDGATLKYALNEQADLFLQLTTVCHSVVCCRVTPLQKAN